MPPDLLGQFQSDSKGTIRSMQLDNDGYYLFTCDMKGYVNTFQLGPPGKERFIKQASELKGAPSARVLAWNDGTGELFTANQNGNFTVWVPKEGTAVQTNVAHEDAITQIQWFEKS